MQMIQSGLFSETIDDWTGLGTHDFTGSCGGAVMASVYDCDASCFNDEDGDGVCDGVEIAGCTDSTACNYATNATDDNGSCEFLSRVQDVLTMMHVTMTIQLSLKMVHVLR